MRYTISFILLFIATGTPLVAQTGSFQSITDTLAEFKATSPHFKNIYTRKDSPALKDSSFYAILNNNALLGKAELPRFSSDFEGGNLGIVVFSSIDTVYQENSVASAHYIYNIYTEPDPLNPVDTLLEPSSRWFYFKIENAKDKLITLNFRNTDPYAPVFSYNGLQWQQFDTTEVKYSFTRSFNKESVYIAYSFPYTMRQLGSKIEQWQYKPGVSVFTIGKETVGDQELKMLLITNTFVKEKNKKKVYIHARIHPSETPSSLALEGLIDYLAGPSPYAKALRDNFIFYILPFTNPTGVEAGLSRSASSGVNLEINYNRPDSLTTPEVKNIKKFIQTTSFGGKPIDMFINFHSQVANNQTFWLHTAETTSAPYFKSLSLFATLTTSLNPNFSNKTLSFSNMNSKYLEGYFWDNFKEKTLALTYETPYNFTMETLKEQGVKILQSIGDYYQIKNEERIIAAEPSKAKGCKKQSDNDYIYLGKCYYTASSPSTAIYKFKKLPAGEYIVYKWVVGPATPEALIGSDTVNCWERVGEFSQQRSGNVAYRLEVADNEEFSALLLLKKQ